MIVDYLLRVAQIGSTWVLYLLLALSVISIGVIVERWLQFRKLRDPRHGLREKVVSALRRGDLADAERLLDADPFAREGLVAERDVREWTPVFGPWSA